MAEQDADVVVIGAGHNALITAAYLAKAGLSVTVLEAREIIGGGTVTEELTVPGFKHDTFSTAHPLLLNSPIYNDDELGVFARGLTYYGNDPATVLPFKDGECIRIWKDIERTAEEFRHFSEMDARAWLDFCKEWESLWPSHMARYLFAPGAAPEIKDKEAEARYLEIQKCTGLETVAERFESDYVRAVFYWFGIAYVQPIDQPGTGIMPLSGPIGWRGGWPNAVGGSMALPLALAEVVAEHGGKVFTSARVSEILTEGNRARGVRCADGRVFRARRAVVSSMHFTQLSKVVKEKLPSEFLASAEKWRAGPSVFVVHIAAPRNIRFRTREGTMASVVGGQAPIEGVPEMLHNNQVGKLTEKDPWALIACSTWLDPSRAPGDQATLKFITQAPYDVNGDARNWDDIKEEYADYLVAELCQIIEGFEPHEALGRCVHSPLDVERRNIAMWRGGPQGGELTPDQMGQNRPAPGWANYRLPVPGLYQTGSSAHPGGVVSGWSGRHAARAVMEDLQVDWRGVMTEMGSGNRREVEIKDMTNW